MAWDVGSAGGWGSRTQLVMLPCCQWTSRGTKVVVWAGGSAGGQGSSRYPLGFLLLVDQRRVEDDGLG